MHSLITIERLFFNTRINIITPFQIQYRVYNLIKSTKCTDKALFIYLDMRNVVITLTRQL